MVADILNVGVNAANWLTNQRQRRREFDEHKRQFDLNYAQQQRQFETAIQTRVADLEAAGLHRSLAAGSQGASAPMATSGGSPKSSPIEARLGIMEVAKRQQELRQMRAQAKLIEAQAVNVSADTDFKRQHLEHEKGAHPYRLSLSEAQISESVARATNIGYKNMLEQFRREIYPELTEHERRVAEYSASELLLRYNYALKHGAYMPTRNQMAVEIDQLLKELGEPTSTAGRIGHISAKVLSRFLGR
ncbi:DNA pilot protein [Tortoise microvirus 28]|nr:DNA pilot protein [Tortoise microvirus 28]